MARSITDQLRHPDWLGEMQVAVGAAAAFLVAAILVDGARSLTGDTPVEVQLDALEVSDLALPPGTHPASWGSIDLAITDPSAAQRLWGLLGWLPARLVLLAVAVLLWRALWVARRRDPFAAEVVRGVRVSAFVLLGGGCAAAVAAPLASLALARTVETEALAFSFSVNPVWVLAGVGFLAVGEILRRGRRLRDELAEVI
ncbi:MAG: hypothetical protein U0Q15_21075 [Kineosporiaceae bacterium]